MISQERLWKDIETIATMTEEGSFARRCFTKEYRQARAWLQSEFDKLGMETTVDPAGNMIGRLKGHSDLPAIATGSHLDTVQNGGRFDGIAGVLAGLEVARSIVEQGIVTKRDFLVIDFTSEEPSDFGISCIGSRAMAGKLPKNALERQDRSGLSLDGAIRLIGGAPEQLDQCVLSDSDIAKFVELHIEQGPHLEDTNTDVGIVSSIVGIQRIEVVIEGTAAHSGTTPMNLRKDAFNSASYLFRFIHDTAISFATESEHYFVATIGQCSVFPNGANVVPNRCTFTCDIRSSNDAMIVKFINILKEVAQQIQEQHQTPVGIQILSSSPAEICDADIQRNLTQYAEELNLTHCTMASGAGHDAAYINKICPSSMIFIPSKDGRSHCPEEYSSRTQLFKGTLLLEKYIMREAC
ncbi:Zn-dependent hydrolase (plasmid) [Photobacterium sp. GJ3]|uniref:Zn-dependent hydrolase n=1 Tax=Photobacterium sp. GJ3 TaxID=2829502 RepID=UPI001B8CBF88|nr:Zn-dependent hydrolase [Photobacterium sp. GJ3]QUJ70233.1 Zn-dependent hydrolase [Photobacterium sp. GJ3]